MELELLKIKRQGDKGKSGMKEEETPVTLTPIEKEIEGDKEIWLERVNFHLEELLQKSNRYNKIVRHMAYHYRTRNKICNIRVKQMKARLRRDIKEQKRRIGLGFLLNLSWLILMLDDGVFHQF